MTETKPTHAMKPGPLGKRRPYACTHFGGPSEIEVFIQSLGTWVAVAEVFAANGHDAEDIAEKFVEALNENEVTRTLFQKQ